MPVIDMSDKTNPPLHPDPDCDTALREIMAPSLHQKDFVCNLLELHYTNQQVESIIVVYYTYILLHSDENSIKKVW